MNSPKPAPMPPQPTTKPVSAVGNQLEAILSELREVSGGVTFAIEQGKSTNVAIGELTRRVSALETHRNVASAVVRGTSENDMKQDAAIASIIVDMQSLKASQATQTTMLTAMYGDAKGFLSKHPKIAAAVVQLVGAAIGAATMWFAARGH